MSNKRTTNEFHDNNNNNNNNTNPKKLRIKEYIPTLTQEKKNVVSIIPEEKKKSRHGIWTKPKELVLLQAYADIWPPSWKRGTISDAWKRVLDRVNAVAPDDTGLGYDACRRSVERLVNKYQQSFEQLPDQSDFEGDTMKEVAFTILKLRQTDEKKGKKEKRLEFDRRIKDELAVIENTNTADQTVVEPTSESTITTTEENTINHHLRRPDPHSNHNNINQSTWNNSHPPHPPTPPPPFHPPHRPPSPIPRDPSSRDFWERHLQTQEQMCSLLKSIADSSKETVELLKVLENRSRKDS